MPNIYGTVRYGKGLASAGLFICTVPVNRDRLRGMKLLLLILCLAFAFAVPAQTKNPRLPNADVTVRYDRFKDTTTIRYAGGFLKDVVPRMSFDVFAFANGQDVSRVDAVALVLTSDSDDWVFLRSANVLRVIIDDGKPLDLGEMKRQGEVYKGKVIETLSLRIPFATFKKVAQASKVEMQVSRTEFQLSSAHIMGLHDFLFAIEGEKGF